MSAEHSERRSRGRGSRIPKISWETAVDSLGIPRSEIDRPGVAETMVILGSRRVFVEYPGWWQGFVVCGNDHGKERSLLGFVLEATCPDFGSHGLETLYLGMIDLGRIPPKALQGLQARKLPSLPRGRIRLA